ncbi:MAG: hypothetical protein CMJ19_01445 [Phycisphaeraceae bacterium]|nr:hypothetical protein [Phycisphaeraceae bacterium]
MTSKTLHRLFWITPFILGVLNLIGGSLYVFSNTWIRIQPDMYKIENGQVYLRSTFWTDTLNILFFNGLMWLCLFIVYAIYDNHRKYRKTSPHQSNSPDT